MYALQMFLSREMFQISATLRLFEHPVDSGASDLWNTQIPYRPRMREMWLRLGIICLTNDLARDT